MVYETTVHEGPGVMRTALRSAGLLSAGVLLGVMLMQVWHVPLDARLQDALQAGSIAGEDWHGNVRSSAR